MAARMVCKVGCECSLWVYSRLARHVHNVVVLTVRFDWCSCSPVLRGRTPQPQPRPPQARGDYGQYAHTTHTQYTNTPHHTYTPTRQILSHMTMMGLMDARWWALFDLRKQFFKTLFLISKNLLASIA